MLYNNGSILVLYYDCSVDEEFPDGKINIACGGAWRGLGVRTQYLVYTANIDYIASDASRQIVAYLRK